MIRPGHQDGHSDDPAGDSVSEDSQQGAPDVTNRAQAPTVRPVTDEPSVDDAMRPLDALVELPVADHVGVFDEAHRKLQDTLADLDEE